jgi:hypothetical protein
MSEETYEQKNKRLSRERSARYRAANRERLAEERKINKEILKAYKEGKELPPPPPAPVVQPVVPAVVVNKKTNNKKVVFTQDVVIQKLKELDIAKEKTRKKYINDIKTVFTITQCPDLGSCLKQFDKIKKELDNAKQKKDPTKDYSINSKKAFIQSIVFIIDKLEIPLDPELRKKYVEYFAVYKVKSSDLTKEKKDSEQLTSGAVVPFHSIQKNVIDKYGEDSKQNLILSFYKFAPMRDDFGSLEVIASSRNDKDSTTNYLLIPRQDKQNCSLVINSYKTDKRYGVLKFKFDKTTSDLVRKYVKKNNIEYNSKLFPENKSGELSSYIGKFLKTANVAEGNINYLRHVIFTEDLNRYDLTPEEIVRLATRAGHSVVAHYQYVRKLIE